MLTDIQQLAIEENLHLNVELMKMNTVFYLEKLKALNN